ncbi:TetR/AcrR family transcriptional regulator [Paracoccus sp. JM45]|uniref:TetR/AcrR family transcriptional regulator n=1 Tax=Paracoccus sp. JM45 TaxID=2283626 RepID=UPI000E6C4B5A|nr:TetR/AcrR family transcriptional regulator [Paracoccus sp. JM45]RJE81526.1 TetR family transcriptional regulator [Paracoccus sp. JM45]
MNTDLRDKRRRQTARDIQLAALWLATRHGYGAITTEAIATEAGVSPRTFFNYYNNKQAAIIGQPTLLNAADNAWIITSDQPLIDDLLKVLTHLLENDQPDRELIRMIKHLSDCCPELFAIFRDSMDQIASVLGGLLVERLGSTHHLAAQLLADMAVEAFCAAVMQWAVDDTMTEAEIPELVRSQLTQVRDYLGTA